MKRIVTTLALAFAACEGEPPKTPAGHAGLIENAVSPPEEQAQEPTAPVGTANVPAAAGGVALCPCACQCGAADAAAALADGGGTAAAPAPPPPVATKGAISGNITTTPKGYAGSAVVWLEDAPVEPTAKMSVTIDNHMMTFAPFIGVIPVGGKAIFHNSDPFPHNVFSPDNEKFDMGVIPQNQGRARTFKSAGSYTVLCNLHPGMIGYVVVTPSSYFAKADGKGHYRLKDVPNGTYQMTAWAPRQVKVTQAVTVKDGGDVTLDFELHR
jgi:plastocyanin